MPFMTAVSISFGTFVVSGTMTGDIVCYSRTGNQAVGATAIAFLLSNLPFLLLGVLIAAGGQDLMEGFAPRHVGALAYLLGAIAIMSNWASCDACLNNASISLQNILPNASWPMVVLITALLAAGFAALDWVGPLFDWIVVLSLVVPPLGAIMVADYYVARGHLGFAVSGYQRVNWAAILAYLSGVSAAVLIKHVQSDTFFPAAGMLAAMVSYTGLRWILPRTFGNRLVRLPTGAEAVDQ